MNMRQIPSLRYIKDASLKSLVKVIMSLSIDTTGQMANAKLLDRILFDIFGQKKFINRMCNCVHDYELYALFNGLEIQMILDFFSNPTISNSILEMCTVQRDMHNVKSKIKSKIKKGNKNPKELRERYKKLEKFYNKSIKAYHELLGIKKAPKGNNVKLKDRYQFLNEIQKTVASPYADYAFFTIDDDDDDYDDFDDEMDELLSVPRSNRAKYKFPGGLGAYSYDEKPTKRPKPATPAYAAMQQLAPKEEHLNLLDEEDDEDLSEDDIVMNEKIEEISARLEEQTDMTEKTLAALGKVISLLEIDPSSNEQYASVSMPARRPRPVPAQSMSTISMDDDGEFEGEDLNEDPMYEELSNKIDFLKESLASVLELIDNKDIDPDTVEANEALDALLNGCVDEVMSDPAVTEASISVQEITNAPEVVTSEEVSPEKLSTPELIEKVNVHKSKAGSATRKKTTTTTKSPKTGAVNSSNLSEGED